MFELKKRDASGRIGSWSIKKHKIQTPTIAIVVNPNKPEITPKELKRKFKADLLITNAYIIKNSKHRQEIENKGLHKFYGWRGPIYTDSGTFQMYSKGSVRITPKETIDFQKKIGSDIITPLDEFTLPTDTRKTAAEKLKTTITRIKQAKNDIGSTALLNGPVQGGIFRDLRQKAAKEVTKTEPDIFSIGGIVPLMEQYRYKDLVDIIISTKKHISSAKPTHAFGCGHPMIFSFLVALGIDVFDSAAYAIFARSKRYMTPTGTLDLNTIEDFPCTCPICIKNTPKEITETDLARHNLFVTFSEIRTIKDAIQRGALWDLVDMRARAHPKIYEAYKALQKHNNYLEKQEPANKKRAFFYTGIESKNRPEIYRAKKQLKQVTSKSRKYQWMGLKIPATLKTTYPFGQSIVPGYFKPKHKTDPMDNISSIVQYQYGKNAKKIFSKKTTVEISEKTKRIRRVWDEKTLLGTIRASDGLFVPSFQGAKKLHTVLTEKKYCVVVDDSVTDFAALGKNIFAKFVKYADKNIRPGDSVFVVDAKNKLLSCGTALMNEKEMDDFNTGVAVRVKHH
ncbi:MAG: tRNA guanosine(15) transglycosylase TgtA [Candidatus Aenigmarchaeota archaeon]|nr:tRNA guanosine(15) transglycosylase TgtA [Candidatus Aenigmarchaeota archaeon]